MTITSISGFFTFSVDLAYCARRSWLNELALGQFNAGDPYSKKELNVKGWGLKCALFEPVGQRNTTAISIEHQMNRFLLLPNHSNSDQPIFCTGSLFSVLMLLQKRSAILSYY